MSSSSKQQAYRYGLLAEFLTMLLLICKGYRMLAWRYKTRLGEVDIIAKRGRHLVFIEVKARKNALYLYDALTSLQQERIYQTALHFIRKHPGYSDCTPRFDLMIVRGLRLHHIPYAW